MLAAPLPGFGVRVVAPLAEEQGGAMAALYLRQRVRLHRCLATHFAQRDQEVAQDIVANLLIGVRECVVESWSYVGA